MKKAILALVAIVNFAFAQTVEVGHFLQRYCIS
jgi:hypothetical protein